MFKEFSAGCFVLSLISGKWHVLLISQISHSERVWVIPKGKIEQDESIVECAQREVEEETGLDLGSISKGDLKSIGINRYTYINDRNEKVNKKVTWFWCKVVDPALKGQVLTKGEENKNVKPDWVDVKKALEILRFDGQRKLLEKIIAQL